MTPQAEMVSRTRTTEAAIARKVETLRDQLIPEKLLQEERLMAASSSKPGTADIRRWLTVNLICNVKVKQSLATNRNQPVETDAAARGT